MLIAVESSYLLPFMHTLLLNCPPDPFVTLTFYLSFSLGFPSHSFFILFLRFSLFLSFPFRSSPSIYIILHRKLSLGN